MRFKDSLDEADCNEKGRKGMMGVRGNIRKQEKMQIFSFRLQQSVVKDVNGKQSKVRILLHCLAGEEEAPFGGQIQNT